MLRARYLSLRKSVRARASGAARPAVLSAFAVRPSDTRFSGVSGRALRVRLCLCVWYVMGGQQK